MEDLTAVAIVLLPSIIVGILVGVGVAKKVKKLNAESEARILAEIQASEHRIMDRIQAAEIHVLIAIDPKHAGKLQMDNAGSLVRNALQSGDYNKGPKISL